MPASQGWRGTSREPHHSEGEGFREKVSQVPEHNGQIDLPDGEHLHSRDDPVERCGRRPQLGSRDAHVVKCRHIEHVDPASSIHQDPVDLFGLE
jgi:hypothetical protein